MERWCLAALLVISLCAAARADLDRQDAQPEAAADEAAVEAAPELNDFEGDVEINGRAHWGGREESTGEELLRQQIEASLTQAREEGVDVVTWRDRVEDGLVALRDAALPLLRMEAETRRGYELSAVQVAVFRLSHAVLEEGEPPRMLVREWLERHYGIGVAAKVTHLAALRETFPHHLFYMVEPRGKPVSGGNALERQVLAVAGDGRIDPLPDDLAVGRFMALEFPAALRPAVRLRAAGAAALLTLGREVTVYTPALMEDDALPGGKAFAVVQAEGQRARAEVEFDRAGRVSAVRSGGPGPGKEGAGTKPAVGAAAMKVPEAGAPPLPPE